MGDKVNMHCFIARIRSPVLVISFILGCSCSAFASEFKSYPLPPDTIDAVRAALVPLLGEQAKVSQIQGRLLVVGSNADHAIVDALLRDLEEKTLQYTVTVIQGASRQQAHKLLAKPGRQRILTVNSEPNEARIASVRLVAGETATVRTDQARDKASSAWSGQRSSGFVNTEEVISRGFEVSVVPKGSSIEVTIEPLLSFSQSNDPATRIARTGKTKLVVSLDKWVTVYSEARFDQKAYDQSSTLLRVSLAD